MEWDNERWPNFPREEMECSQTGKCDMDPDHMDKLQALRDLHGPLYVTSGYRDATHPIEARKAKPGEHSIGKGTDVGCWSDEAFAIAKLAFQVGFTRIGVSQSGSVRFIHLGSATPEEGFPQSLYSYKG